MLGVLETHKNNRAKLRQALVDSRATMIVT